ncbi:MAG TPA: ATP-binding protein [Firmicutes bacterium]|nr:ATP-binding protein [Candidatus Fermentithermobacillaceae bacterium]
MNPYDYEKLGVFYLGRPYDQATRTPQEGLILYDSKDLVTHGVCVGMTGSGKTGLCIALLEEAAIDGIPAIIIDPKGDMANLLLTFPGLSPEDFRPWINEDDARKKNLSPDGYAVAQAELWKKGLASWGQDGERIRRLKNAAEFAIYTPGSTAGIPVSILKSFSAPPRAIIEDTELLTERVTGTTSSLLGLIGITADPIQSREHILMSNILYSAWQQGIDLDLPTLIQQINAPPFNQIGVMSLESFFPASERFKLAIQFNNLLAAPGFAPWMQGEPLDIDSILHTPSGKPRVSIFSIAHLSDTERMFFVALLLNHVLSWTRVQPGTTSLRAILYMDEIAGYFPPVANPPSKAPLLTLLKQARAFGLGVLLTTQNPVDLDYKGLSNTGTWFIGRLQTERDKMRVLDGLEGAAGTQGMRFDRREMEKILAGLGRRVFLMNNVHDDAPTIFETRWVMSYLRGPLTRNQISQLTESVVEPQIAARVPAYPGAGIPYADAAAGVSYVFPGTGIPAAPGFGTPAQSVPDVPAAGIPVAGTPVPGVPVPAITDIPVLPPGIKQYFLPIRERGRIDRFIYMPMILGSALVGFRDTKSKTDLSRDYVLATPVSDEAPGIDWDEALEIDVAISELETSPVTGVSFAPLPASAEVSRNYTSWAKGFADWLYRTQQVELMMSPTLKTYSMPGESERDFRLRLDQAFREKRDEALDALRRKYASKIDSAAARLRTAEDAVERQKMQAKQQQMQTAISVGATLLTSLLGSKKLSQSTIGRATTTARSASRYTRDQSDVARREETAERYREQLRALEDELHQETTALSETLSPLNEVFEPYVIRPYKKDIYVNALLLVWIPMQQVQPKPV